MGYKIGDIKGVPAGLIQSLQDMGLGDTDALLLALVDPEARAAAAGKLGIDEGVLAELVNQADLLRVPGIGPAYTSLLNAAGVHSVADLRAAGPGLYDRLVQAGGTLGVKRLPKGVEVTSWVTSAATMQDAAGWAVTTRSAAMRGLFAEDEWQQITQAPLAAAALVVNASPSDSKDVTAELWGAAVAVNSARAAARPESLVNLAFPQDLSADEFARFMGETPPAALLSLIAAATDVVRAKADAGQLAAYQQMIIHVAQQAAESARESGGFLGMGKKLVSEEEEAVLDQIYDAVV